MVKLYEYISEISKVKYIRNIVIGLDRANEKEFKKQNPFFKTTTTA